MGKALDAFLDAHTTPGEAESRRRSLGPRATDFGRPKPLLDRSIEAGEALLVYLREGRSDLDKAIENVQHGLAIATKIRHG